MINISVGNLMTVLIPAIMGFAALIMGLRTTAFGSKFRNNAKETQALVLDRMVESKTTTQTHGGYSTKAHYYLVLQPNVSDLPSTVKLEVRSDDYVTAEKGEIIKIYYLPNDAKHISLQREIWGALGKALMFFSILLFVIAAIIAYSEFGYLFGGVGKFAD